MSEQTTPAPSASVLIDAMVLGAHIGGGLTPDRRDIMRSIVSEHVAFTDTTPEQLVVMVSSSQARLEGSSVEAALSALSGGKSAFQLMVIIALVEEEGEEKTDELLAAGEGLGLTAHAARAVLGAGIPPALLDIRVSSAPEETYLDVLLAAAAADGQLAAEEMDALVQFACSRLEFNPLPRQQIEDLMQASLQGFLDYGFSFWLETLADDLPEPDQRQTALRLATEMVEADARVTPDETEFLSALKLALHL